MVQFLFRGESNMYNAILFIIAIIIGVIGTIITLLSILFATVIYLIPIRMIPCPAASGFPQCRKHPRHRQ